MLFAFAVPFAIPLAFSLGAVAQSKCKCVAGQACWPSAAQWAAFDKNLTSPTVKLLPVAAPCYKTSPNYNANACGVATSNYYSTLWRAEQPAAVQFTVWEQIITNNTVYSCDIKPLNDKDVCYQGRVPSVAVMAKTVADIKATLKFVKQYNLKMVIRNSGHDTIGRANGPGALSLNMRGLNSMSYNAKWLPKGAPSGTATADVITVGGGATWRDVYPFAQGKGRALVGAIGAEGTVGASGGFISGGGQSLVAPFYGLGIDQVLEFGVLLPNTTEVVANAYTNTDLFWALRGGGAPSFGIITSTTYRTHPIVPLTSAFFTSTFTDPAVRRKLLTAWMSIQTKVRDAGWSGLWPYDETSLAITLLSQGNPPTNSAALSTMQNFYNLAKNMTGVNVTLATFKAYPSYYQWYYDNDLHTELGLGYNFSIGDISGVTIASGSRLIPRETFDNNLGALTEALINFPTARPFLVGGGEISKIDKDATAITPGWRTALMNVALGAWWQDETPVTDITKFRQQVHDNLDVLRAMTPNSGSFVNEGEIFDTTWRQSFWGDHYPRLQAIKKAIDPDDDLVVIQGVNAENWDAEIICRK